MTPEHLQQAARLWHGIEMPAATAAAIAPAVANTLAVTRPLRGAMGFDVEPAGFQTALHAGVGDTGR